jgi:integrase
MATREKVTSAFAPDLEEVRAWLQKMVAALRFVDLVTAVLALIARMRDINTELVAQIAHLRRSRPRSEVLRRLERQLVLPIDGLTVPSSAKPILRNWVERAQRRAGFEPTGNVHILRHTFCSHLAVRGAPAKAIQELAGHANLTTTLRYMHLSPSARDRAIELLNDRGSNGNAVATTAGHICN